MSVSLTIYRQHIGTHNAGSPKVARKFATCSSMYYFEFFIKSNSIHNKISLVLMLFALAIFHSTYFCRLLAKKRRGTPSSCFLLVFTAYACFLKFKLILSGDIHVNPGPTNPHTMCGRFKFGHWNVNSLLARNKAKIPLIEALQSIHNFDLFAISESFLNLNTNISDLKIHGFSPVPLRNDCNRANIHPQGGVCLYYKEHVPLVHRTDLQFLDECIICEVKIDKNKKMFFIAV